MPRKANTAQALKDWRGNMKLERAAVYASDMLGDDISRETIRRYESGRVPADKMKAIVIWTLALVYGRTVEDLPEDTRERVGKLRDRLLVSIDSDPEMRSERYLELAGQSTDLVLA